MSVTRILPPEPHLFPSPQVEEATFASLHEYYTAQQVGRGEGQGISQWCICMPAAQPRSVRVRGLGPPSHNSEP
jgi:hypothetical protein